MKSKILIASLLGVNLFADCSMGNSDIAKALDLTNHPDAKIIDISTTDYLDGYCTVVIEAHGDVDIAYVNTSKQRLILPRHGNYTYALKNGKLDKDSVKAVTELEKLPFRQKLEEKRLNNSLAYLNKVSELNKVYFDEILDTKSETEYQVFTFSSDLCPNCISFKKALQNEKVKYLYLPISQNDYMSHVSDSFMRKNMDFIDRLSNDLKQIYGTPTTLVYSNKTKKFVAVYSGSSKNVIAKIKEYLK